MPSARPLLDVLAALGVVTLFWLPGTTHAGSGLAAGASVALAAATVAAMLGRHRAPTAATSCAAAATVAGTLLGVCTDPMLAAAWCLYPLAVRLVTRRPVPLSLVTGLIVGLVVVAAVPDHDPEGLGRRALVAVVALTVSWLVGALVGRQAAVAREQARLAVAREVHDVVGHALGVIGAEAGVTRALPDADEQELRAALADIETHARASLTQVQTLVRALRAAEPDGPENPGTAGLAALVAAVRSAGVRVEARLAVPRPLPAPVDAVAYRIVQESLSNVVRHAPGSRCRVAVRDDGAAVHIEVRDDGPGAASSAAGSGLAGMRERAGLVGGTVSWGSRPGGGFAVEARLPARRGR